MAIIDKNLNFHNDTVVTTAATYSGDSLALREVATLSSERAGQPLQVVVRVTGDFNSGGTNITFRLVSSNAADLSSPVTQHTSAALADPAAGTEVIFPLTLPVTDADATHIGVTGVSTGTYTPSATEPCTFSAWISGAGEEQFTIND